MSDRIDEDLEASGLVRGDLGIKELDNSVRAATKTAHHSVGYVIPYFSLRGAPVPFYRVKIFDEDIKYKQPKETPTHVYFPKGFLQLADTKPYIIITEGEKKAAAAVKAGYPAVGLGGIDSWRNRQFSIPVDTELNAKEKNITGKLPSGAEVEENFLSPLAYGLQDLLDYALSEDKHLIILYDTDEKFETSHKVLAASAVFGYELRFRGIPYNRIRQIRLPLLSGHNKLGLDDYIQATPPDTLQVLIDACLEKASAFPRHPNVRDYLNKRLQKPKMSRKEQQQVAMAILSELDANGMRLHDPSTKQTYYFDRKRHKLLKADFTTIFRDMTESPFGQFLYRNFGIGTADNKLIQWIGTQFTGEEPIKEVSPYRVLARANDDPKLRDTVIIQVGDGNYAKVSADGMTICDNGDSGILFESGYVKEMDLELLKKHYAEFAANPKSLTPWWSDVLNEVRLVDKDRQRIVTALLFYIAPWLQRWRGTQLPIEMTLGEAGSGKSTLQELRLEILSGIAHLRNVPTDMKDWTASVANTGDLHILDNVQLADKGLRQRMSDEYCRLITEPEPTIEARKLYTNNDLIRVPARCQFGITAIKQPFLNADILARAVIIELDKSLDQAQGNLSYDASWKSRQVQRYGGREAWVAHHLYVLHRFFALTRTKWNFKYQAKFRLINVEQAMGLMAEVFGINGSWIPDYLNKSLTAATISADWALEGIITFSMHWAKTEQPGKTFTVQNISEWALSYEDFERCEELVNTRRLGKYMQTHKSIIMSEANIVECGKANNRTRYTLRK